MIFLVLIWAGSTKARKLASVLDILHAKHRKHAPSWSVAHKINNRNKVAGCMRPAASVDDLKQEPECLFLSLSLASPWMRMRRSRPRGARSDCRRPLYPLYSHAHVYPDHSALINSFSARLNPSEVWKKCAISVPASGLDFRRRQA